MAAPAVSGPNKRPPNLWKEAYNALHHDDKGKERLDKLNVILRERLDKPNLKVRSEEGYKRLQTLINEKSKELSANKSSEKIGKICDNMLTIQDLVAAGANIGGPYVAIPAAALFLVFSVQQIYRSERDAMFELAKKVAHYTVLHATSAARIKIMPDDDANMRDLKKNLHMLYVGLYKLLLLASAQLTISLYGDWQFVKNLMKHYDWEGQTKELDAYHALCKDYRDEMTARQNDPSIKQVDQKTSMGPGPRNQLHWAVALSVPEQVTHLVQEKEFPINALTPKRWTAAHLAAREGNTKILKTLLTANGIDLGIKNDEGYTPLHVAALWNKVGAVKLLLERDYGLLGLRENRGWTAFLFAAWEGHVQVLKAFKTYGQDFNETTSNSGWTGLHLAAEGGHVETVRYLLENGTKKWLKITGGKEEGKTAKDIAERKKKFEVVALL